MTDKEKQEIDEKMKRQFDLEINKQRVLNSIQEFERMVTIAKLLGK